MSDIKPALTPEEWARFRAGEHEEMVLIHATRLREVNGQHFRAAIALDGEPFGFTWEDVDLIRAALSVWDGMEMNEDGLLDHVSGRIPESSYNVADRIASLLPPRVG